MRKICRWMAATGVASVIGIAANGHSSAQAVTTWEYYLYTGVNHPITDLLTGFADDVRKQTNGALVINVRPAGELPFKATEVVKIVGSGQVQMGSASPGFVGASVQLATVGNHMGLIRTYEDMRKVWPIIQKYTEPKFQAAGAHILFHWNWPTQQVFGIAGSKPIQTLSDFAGHKIRIVAPQETEMLVRLKAAAVNLTTPEVPMALERGIADGLVSAAFNVVGSKWYEFFKWIYVSNLHLAGPNFELVNAEAYNKLDPRLRATLDKVAAEWSDKMNRDISTRDDADLKTLSEKYGLKLYQASPADITELAKRMEDYWDSWAATQGPDGVAMMKEIRTTLGR